MTKGTYRSLPPKALCKAPSWSIVKDENASKVGSDSSNFIQAYVVVNSMEACLVVHLACRNCVLPLDAVGLLEKILSVVLLIVFL